MPRACALRFVCKRIVDNSAVLSEEVWELERFLAAKLTYKSFKVIGIAAIR